MVVNFKYILKVYKMKMRPQFKDLKTFVYITWKKNAEEVTCIEKVQKEKKVV